MGETIEEKWRANAKNSINANVKIDWIGVMKNDGVERRQQLPSESKVIQLIGARCRVLVTAARNKKKLLNE